MRNIILILTIITLAISCEPIEVEIKDNFNFDTTVLTESTGKINSEIPLLLTIKPDRLIQGINYSFSFVYKEGNGILLLDNQILQANQTYPLENLSNQLKFRGDSKGKYQIDFTIVDDNANEILHTVEYTLYDDNDFSFNVEAQNLSVFYSQEIPFQFNLTEIDNGSPEISGYTLRYETNNLQTTFLYNEIEYGPGDIIDNISLGEFRAILKSSEPGTSSISFFATSSLGITKSVTYQVEFKPIDFDLNVSFENENPTKSEYTIVNFSIDEVFESNENYEIRYSSDNNSYKLFEGYHCSTNINLEGSTITIPKQSSFLFSGCNNIYDDEITFTFFVKNSTIEKEFSKTVSIKPFDFEFSITPDITTTDLENINKTSRLLIDYAVFLDDDEFSVNNYYMKVTSSLGSGTIGYFSDSYGNGSEFQLIHRNTFFSFTSGVSGEATLTFELVAKDSGLTKTKTMNVRFVD